MKKHFKAGNNRGGNPEKVPIKSRSNPLVSRFSLRSLILYGISGIYILFIFNGSSGLYHLLFWLL